MVICHPEKIQMFLIEDIFQTGLDDAVALSPVNGLVGTEFASRYQLSNS